MKKLRFVNFFLLAMLCLLFFSFALNEPTTNKVRSKVTEPAGSILNNVDLLSEEGQAMYIGGEVGDGFADGSGTITEKEIDDLVKAMANDESQIESNGSDVAKNVKKYDFDEMVELTGNWLSE